MQMDTDGKYIMENGVDVGGLIKIVRFGCDGGKDRRRISTGCMVFLFLDALFMFLNSIDCNRLRGMGVWNSQQE